MRKLFAYAAALVAGGAASVYAAGVYADYHPDSFVNRCLATMYAVAVFDPSAALTQTADAITEAAEDPVSEQYASPAAPVAVKEGDAEEAEAHQPPVIKIEECPPPGKNRLPGTIVVGEGNQPSGAGSASEPEPCEVPPQVRALMEGLRRLEAGKDLGLDECEPKAPFMPYCEDDEPAPAVMPSADEMNVDATCETIFSFWIGFFGGPTVTDAAAPVQSVPKAGTSDCKEDPAYPHQYPGCPACGPCLKGGACGQSEKADKMKVMPGKSKIPYVPFEAEEQEMDAPMKRVPSSSKDLMRSESKFGPRIDTTECRPSDLGFDNLGNGPF
jgi:hypothetical protein